MTVSAAVRLIPTPPARVERMKMNESEFLSEKRSIAWVGVRVKVTVRVHSSGEGVRVCPMAARLLPLCAGHGAVEPLEAPALCIEDVGHEVEHLGEG